MLLLALGLGTHPVTSAGSIHVTTTDDEFGENPAACSLREAIQSVNIRRDFGGCSGMAHGVSRIALPAGVYTLEGRPKEDANAEGDLDITGILIIEGAGSRDTFIQAGTDSPLRGCGDCVDRVVHVHEGARVTISGVTIQHGRTPDGGAVVAEQQGGGISNLGSLVLDACIVRRNMSGHGAAGSQGGGRGGGIFSSGTLSVIDSSVLENATGNGSSPTGATEGGYGGPGGGLFLANGSVTTITDSFVTDNQTGDGGVGGDMDDAPGEDGGGGGDGGGIMLVGALTLTGSAVSDNATGDGGAGGDVLRGDGTGGSGGDGGGGAGLYSFGDTGALTLVRSTVSGNTTGEGGPGGAGSGTGTTGVPGARGRGGGIYLYQGTHALRQCTISGNYARAGAGMYLAFTGPTTVTHCTISGNRAYGYGGGIDVGYVSALALTHVTVVKNTADVDNDGSGNGGGISSVQPITLTSTILADNSSKGGNGQNCAGYIASLDYNLIGFDEGSCYWAPQPHDQVGTGPAIDPLLGPLADNGGDTYTHELLPGSPAIDQIPAGVNGCGGDVTGDQRGEVRLPPCDVGAYEIFDGERVFLPLVLLAHGSP